MKKRANNIIFLILFLILIIPIMYGDFDTGEIPEGTYDPQSPSFWSSPQNYPAASASDVKFGLENGYISDDNFKLLSTSQLEPNIDILSPQQKQSLTKPQIQGFSGKTASQLIPELNPAQENYLTTDQLIHSDNLEKVSDLGNLNQKNLKNAMEIKFNTKVSDVDKNSHLTMNGDVLNTLDITFKDDNSELVMENPLAHDKPLYKYADMFKDSDGDGLSDKTETQNNLDPNKKDTDGDGLSDYDEMMSYPTDSRKYNTYPETGYENDFKFVEYFLSNPTILNEVKTLSIENNPLQDRDGDGISDLTEVSFTKTNYSSHDSDGDGLGDGYEIANYLSATQTTELPVLIFEKDCKDCLIKVNGNKGERLKINFNTDSFLTETNTKVSIGGKNAEFISNTPMNGFMNNKVTKTQEGYNIISENTNSTVQSNEYKEIVLGEKSKYETILDDGIIYAEINSAGRYEYISVPMKSFAVVRNENHPYYIYIDKPSKRLSYDEYKLKKGKSTAFAGTESENPAYINTENKNTAYISTEEHIINLNGEIRFLKNEPYSFIEHPLYVSFDRDNDAELMFDNNNIYVNITLTNKGIICTKNKTISSIYSGMFMVSEVCREGDVESLGKFIDAVPNYVKEYTTNLQIGINYFNKDLFKQEAATAVKMTSFINYEEITRLKKEWEKLRNRLAGEED